MLRRMLSLPRCFLLLGLLATACGGGGEPLFLTVEDDKALGAQVSQQILSDPTQFPVLDEQAHPEAYAYLRAMVDSILQSGRVRHAQDFEWRIWIIDRDDVKNAFCVPGGNIFVYTGLIQTLDHDYELAGVLGHEIAHADLRHTSRSLEKVMGLQLLAQILLGQDQNALSDLAQQLAGLGFSRKYESEADAMSVTYLCHTRYEAYGAAVFFEKMQDAGEAANVPVFLSTHPDPGNRVQAIRQRARQLGCDAPDRPDRYAWFKQAVRGN